MKRQYLKWTIINLLWIFTLPCTAQSVAQLLEKAQYHIQEKNYIEAYSFYYEASHQQTVDLTDSISVRKKYETNQLLIDAIQTIIKIIHEPDAKKLFYQLEFKTYETTIDLAHRLFEWKGEKVYVEKAFELMEQNRNVWLLNTLRSGQSNLSQAILKKEGQLLSQIKIYEDSLINSKKSLLINKEAIGALEKERDSWQVKYAVFLKENHLLSSSIDAIKLKKLRNELLQKNDVFIEFFNGTKATYCIVIDSKRTDLIKIGKSASLNKLIRTYKKTLHQQEKIFIEQSHQLYEMLIKPLQLQPQQHIILVTDGMLNFIPFEALLTELPTQWNYDFSTLSYLIYQHSFVYQHSATLFSQSQTPTQQINPKLLFLAPAFDKITNALFKPYSKDSSYFKLNPLEQSMALGNILKLEYDGTFLSKQVASYPAFQKEHAHHQILHFATHTQVNDFAPLESKIILSKTLHQNSIEDEGDLPLKVLYQLYLKADLAVLGSCETGGNYLKRGEGLVGMAYGFRLAGVPSVVYSLWEVDEKATNEVLLNFYTELKKGQSKDMALHQAKLNYLKNANEITADPYYWASFVMNGNVQPFRFEQQHKEYWWVGFALLLLFGVTSLGYFKYKKN